jgi:hypothetical protein
MQVKFMAPDINQLTRWWVFAFFYCFNDSLGYPANEEEDDNTDEDVENDHIDVFP